MVGDNSAGRFSGRLGLSKPASQSEASPMRISRNGVGQIGGYWIKPLTNGHFLTYYSLPLRDPQTKRR